MIVSCSSCKNLHDSNFFSGKRWQTMEGVPWLQGKHWFYTPCEFIFSMWKLLLWEDASSVTLGGSLIFFQDDAKKHDRFTKSRYLVWFFLCFQLTKLDDDSFCSDFWLSDRDFGFDLIEANNRCFLQSLTSYIMWMLSSGLYFVFRSHKALFPFCS